MEGPGELHFLETLLWDSDHWKTSGLPDTPPHSQRYKPVWQHPMISVQANVEMFILNFSFLKLTHDTTSALRPFGLFILKDKTTTTGKGLCASVGAEQRL